MHEGQSPKSKTTTLGGAEPTPHNSRLSLLKLSDGVLLGLLLHNEVHLSFDFFVVHDEDLLPIVESVTKIFSATKRPMQLSGDRRSQMNYCGLTRAAASAELITGNTSKSTRSCQRVSHSSNNARSSVSIS